MISYPLTLTPPLPLSVCELNVNDFKRILVDHFPAFPLPRLPHSCFTLTPLQGKVYGTAAGIPDKSLLGDSAKMFLGCYYDTMSEATQTNGVHPTAPAK